MCTEHSTPPTWQINFLNVTLCIGLNYFYRPQRSCGQGNVFTGVCLSTGGRVSASVHAGIPYPPGPGIHTPPRNRETPPLGPGRPPRDQADPHPGTKQTSPQDQADPPRDQADLPREADSSIRSTSGRYASYWNAFLSMQFYSMLTK